MLSKRMRHPVTIFLSTFTGVYAALHTSFSGVLDLLFIAVGFSVLASLAFSVFFGFLAALWGGFSEGMAEQVAQSSDLSETSEIPVLYDDVGTSLSESDAIATIHSSIDELGETTINPATGLLMVGGIGGVDVAGNPFGSDLHAEDLHSIHQDLSHGMDDLHTGFDDVNSGFDDFTSSMDDFSSSFDDSFYS